MSDLTEKNLNKKKAIEMIKKDPIRIISSLTLEIDRLRKLCEQNNIDTTLPMSNPNLGIKTEAKVTVFNTKEESEEFQKSQI